MERASLPKPAVAMVEDIFEDEQTDSLKLIKCHYCDDMIDANKLRFVYPAIYIIHGPQPSGFSTCCCSNGHFMRLEKRQYDEYVTVPSEWYRGIPGSTTHLLIFDFTSKKWIQHLCVEIRKSRPNLFEQYAKQHIQWRIERRESRNAWLQCARKMGICKDLRLMIACYVNREPIVFWDEHAGQEEGWCVIQ